MISVTELSYFRFVNSKREELIGLPVCARSLLNHDPKSIMQFADRCLLLSGSLEA